MIKILFILFSLSAWSKDTILVSYFDAFGKAPFNNSERVAKAIAEEFSADLDVDIELCKLNTVFDTSFHQLESCYKDMPVRPKIVLGLGESNCNFKLETIVRNKDKTIGPDNQGNQRNNTAIVPEAPRAYGLNYPLPQMYCSLDKNERSKVEVSNNAGSFVCNNLAFQMSHYHPDLEFGFMHVPANNCANLEKKTKATIQQLVKMIKALTSINHFDRLPISKSEIDELEVRTENSCLKDFYDRFKGIDEKNFWPWKGIN